jgi:hypothetical protein
MTATFDETLPTDRDRLRFLLGDTDVVLNPLLQDETYDATLSQSSDWRLAGAALAEGLASKFAQEPDSVSIPGDVSVSWRSRVENWVRLASGWRAAVGIEVGSQMRVYEAERLDRTDVEYSSEGVWVGPWKY